MKAGIIGTIVLSGLLASVQAQTKTVKRNDLVWFGDVSKVKLNDKWSLYFDCGLRRTGWLDKWSQILLRPGVSYNLNAAVSLTAGGAWFEHFSPGIIKNEFRGWEQLQFTEVYGRVKVTHRLRVEQRLNQFVRNNELTEEYRYNARFRYQINMQVPLNRKKLDNKTLYLTAADEIMINYGREIVYNNFDQNRLSVGLGYKLNEKFNMAIMYMNDYIQKNQPASFEENNVIVVNLYHNFSF